MLNRFSKWGRAAAYLVVLGGMVLWVTGGMGPGPPPIILAIAYAAYVAGSVAESRRDAVRRRKILNNNREGL